MSYCEANICWETNIYDIFLQNIYRWRLEVSFSPYEDLRSEDFKSQLIYNCNFSKMIGPTAQNVTYKI